MKGRHLAAFLRAAVLVLALVCLGALEGYSSAAQSGTVTPISHVVVIMMENHSFDNIFGAYPSNNNSAAQASPIIRQIEAPANLLNTKVPAGLSAVPNGTFATQDPNEGYTAYHDDYDGGAMDGFPQHSGPQAMTYFTSSQLAIEWDWAEEYAIADNYFASYLSDTAPNRLMSLAGATPVEGDYGPPPYVPLNESIFGQLSSAGVSWGYYVDGPFTSAYPLDYFSNITTYAGAVKNWSDFATELLGGSPKLPAVSFVMPTGDYAHGVDQHPPDNVTVGELWLLGIVNEVMRSPYWSSTAIFINYDEGGGYYDHVAPPELDGMQLGFRVPLIVISPYAKEGYVSHSLMNHDSILAFIEYNWRMPELNSFVGASVIPLDLFAFNQTARPPLILNASSPYPLAFQVSPGTLPYARSGASSLTLSGPSAPGTSPSPTSPSPSGLPGDVTAQLSRYAGEALVAVAIALFGLAAFAARARRGRRGRRSYY